MEAVDKRNPMLIRAATIVDTEDHRLKVAPPPAPLTTTPLCSPLIRSNLFPSRCISTAGVQSTITGWRPTGLTCTLLAGVKKQATPCSTLTVRNCPLPINELTKVAGGFSVPGVACKLRWIIIPGVSVDAFTVFLQAPVMQSPPQDRDVQPQDAMGLDTFGDLAMGLITRQ